MDLMLTPLIGEHSDTPRGHQLSLESFLYSSRSTRDLAVCALLGRKSGQFLRTEVCIINL